MQTTSTTTTTAKTLCLAAFVLSGSLAAAPANWTNISTATSATVQIGQSLMSKQGFWTYFSANAQTGPYVFPDNAVFQAYGTDPGNCAVLLLPTGTICTNYRFACSAIASAGLSAAPLTFDLIDLNALVYRQKDDPRGTCYLTPYTLQNGTAVLGLSVIFTAEPSYGIGDKVATMGWFAVLGGGSNAPVPNASYLNLVVTYNPRSGDPLSFAFGTGTTALNNTGVFSLIAIGNDYEPIQTSGIAGGVFASTTPAQK